MVDELRALLREGGACKGPPKGWRAAVDAEPELPGGMPDEMGQAVARAMAEEDTDFFLAALRLTVRLTKQSIRDRLANLEASGAPGAPAAARYRVERHGTGWAIYRGRDSQHHGMNLGLLTECSPDLARRVHQGLNALGE